MRRCKKTLSRFMLYFRSEEDMQMKNMIKKVIKKRIEKVKLNGYNCSPCDYYRPKKPSK